MMPNSFQQPEYRPSGGRSYMSGENFGSHMGLPVRRHMRSGSPAGFEIQFQDEWMDMGDFMNPIFQQSFFKPWQAQQRQGSIDDLKGQYGDNPGAMRALGAFSGFNRGSGRRAGPVRSSRSGGGMSFDPAMLDAIMSGG